MQFTVVSHNCETFSYYFVLFTLSLIRQSDNDVGQSAQCNTNINLTDGLIIMAIFLHMVSVLIQQTSFYAQILMFSITTYKQKKVYNLMHNIKTFR